MKIPGSEYSWEKKFQETKVPGPICSGERIFQEAKIPGNESSQEQKFQEANCQGLLGTFAPGSELALEQKGSVPSLNVFHLLGILLPEEWLLMSNLTLSFAAFNERSLKFYWYVRQKTHQEMR